MASNKDVKQVLRAARKQGLVVEQTTRHYRITSPAHPGAVVTVSVSPSDHRSILNTVAALRKEFGFVWKGR